MARAGAGPAGCSGEGSRPDALLREGGIEGRRDGGGPVFNKMTKAVNFEL